MESFGILNPNLRGSTLEAPASRLSSVVFDFTVRWGRMSCGGGRLIEYGARDWTDTQDYALHGRRAGDGAGCGSALAAGRCVPLAGAWSAGVGRRCRHSSRSGDLLSLRVGVCGSRIGDAG